MPVEVCLLCVSRSPVDRSVKVLLREYPTGLGLPTAEVPPADGYEATAAKLLKDSTGVSPTWAQMSSQPVVDLVASGQSWVPRPALLVPMSVLLPECASELAVGLRWVELSRCFQETLVEDHASVLAKFISSA